VRNFGGTVVELISYEGAIVGGLARNGKLTVSGNPRLYGDLPGGAVAVADWLDIRHLLPLIGCGEVLLAMRNARVQPSEKPGTG
jgi:hypothetical protein